MRRAFPYVVTFATCAILAAILWAATGLFLAQAERAVLAEAATRRENVAHSLAGYQASSLRALDLSLVFLRTLWRRNPADFRRAVTDYEQLLRAENVVQVAVVDARGDLLYSHLPISGTPNFSDRPYFQVQRTRAEDALYVSEPVFGRVTGRWAIQVSRPIRDAQGAFAGLIVMAVPPPALEVLLKEIDLGPQGVVTVTRSDGQVLARTRDFERTVNLPIRSWPAISAEGAASGEFTSRGALDGVERYFSYRQVKDYGVAVLVGQGVSAVREPYRAQRNYALGLAGAGTLLLFATGAAVALHLRDRARFAARHETLMLELHDGCIQALYAAGLRLQAIRETGSRDPAAAARAIAEVEADLNLVIHDLRAVIGGGERPRYTAAEFIAQVQRSIPATHRKLFSLEIDEDVAGALPPEKSEHVLRIVREAASNVARHAEARSASIKLARREARVELRVADDGRGSAASHGDRGLGMAHIQARAKKLGGNATVEARPGKGTQITVEFPA